MRPCLAPAVVVFAFLTTPAADDDKANAADLKAMVGKWTITKAELGGQDITDVLKEAKFEILAGGKYTLEIGKESDKGTFAVDVSKSPKSMDVKPTAGPFMGKTMKAIYKLDGDTLSVCYQHDKDADKRPDTFETKDRPTLVLIVYKRVK